MICFWNVWLDVTIGYRIRICDILAIPIGISFSAYRWSISVRFCEVVGFWIRMIVHCCFNFTDISNTTDIHYSPCCVPVSSPISFEKKNQNPLEITSASLHSRFIITTIVKFVSPYKFSVQRLQGKNQKPSLKDQTWEPKSKPIAPGLWYCWKNTYICREHILIIFRVFCGHWNRLLVLWEPRGNHRNQFNNRPILGMRSLQ